MSLDQLWAPWRLAYVAKELPSKDEGCFVCRGLAATDDPANLIVLRTDHSVVLLNRFPYNNGHLLVCPRAHKARLDELSTAEILDGQQTLNKMVSALEALMKPEGFNIGVNLGKPAGAGLPGHLHWHIVPRWNGDTNYMTVISDCRVIVQSLEALYQLLTQHLMQHS
jgi:ATP adenylyltransferase